MFTYTDWLIHLRHHDDLLREAERWRLANLAVSAWSANKTKKKTAVQNIQADSVEVPCCNPAEATCCASAGC